MSASEEDTAADSNRSSDGHSDDLGGVSTSEEEAEELRKKFKEMREKLAGVYEDLSATETWAKESFADADKLRAENVNLKKTVTDLTSRLRLLE